MAKQKRLSRKAADQRSSLEPPMLDRRAMEQIMRQLAAQLGGEPDADTPLDRAQEVMYEAFEAPVHEQVRLAREALTISPDCADAYVLLAEHAKSLDEALAFYQQGTAAGERVLGKKAFQEAVGHFWGLVETRPYMRARERLAQCLWEAGRREEAAEHYQEMLRLNPNDNQGIRWSLVTLLLDLDRDAELGRLLEDYKEDGSPFFAYTRALLAFRQGGESTAANKRLKQAAKCNKHVPPYLLGHKALPTDLPPYMTRGGGDEAASYASANRRVWLNTPGAISWLRKTLRVPLPKPRKPRRPAWPQLRLALNRCPQDPDEIWQVDAVPMRVADPDGPADETPWSVLVVSRENRELQGAEVFGDPPKAEVVWEYLTDIMRKPRQGDPHRPATIEVRQKPYAKAWKAKLKQIGVECLLVDQLDGVDALFYEFPTATRQPAIDVSPQDLLELPLEPGEVWQAGIRRMPSWITGEGEPYRPWIGIVVSRTDDLVLAHDIAPEHPPAGWLWEVILQAVQQPVIGDSRRPGTIEVQSPEQREALLPHLEPVGIECVALGQLEHLDSALHSMAEHLGRQGEPPSLLEVPGIDLAQLGSFYRAAAEFYQRRPWQRVLGDSPIKVECGKFHSGPWYAVVMGQLGVQQGLAVYEDMAALGNIIGGERSDQENARGMSALSLMFGEAFDIPTRELDAAEQHGWPIAGPEAYPQVFRVNPGMALRTPLAWELELLEGCLRAIPDFVAGNNTTLSQTISVMSGNLPLQLSWMGAG